MFRFFYFPALAFNKIRAFSPPGFVKISRTLFTFLDQSHSSAAAILGVYLHPAYIHEYFDKFTKLLHVFFQCFPLDSTLIL